MVKQQGTASVRHGLDPDVSSVLVDDALAHREADTASVVSVTRVKPAKRLEHLIGQFGLDSNAIVRNGETPSVLVLCCSDVHAER